MERRGSFYITIYFQVLIEIVKFFFLLTHVNYFQIKK